MKKSLILVVILLAVASLMAAMAYTKAMVTNNAELKIVNTNKALLALEPQDSKNKGFKDETAWIEDGELKFNFSKGRFYGLFKDKTNIHGLQPYSVYEWVPLFAIHNNSKDTIKVTVSASQNLNKYLKFGVVKNWGDREVTVWSNELKNVIIPEDGRAYIAVKAEIDSPDYIKELKGSIIVKAVPN